MFLHVYDIKKNRNLLDDLEYNEYVTIPEGIYIDIDKYRKRTGSDFDVNKVQGRYEYLKDIPTYLKQALEITNEIVELAKKVEHIPSDPELTDVENIVEIMEIVQENFARIEKLVGKSIDKAIFTPIAILKNPYEPETYIVVHMYTDKGFQKYIVIKVDDLKNTKEIMVGDDYLSMLLHGNEINLSDM